MSTGNNRRGVSERVRKSALALLGRARKGASYPLHPGYISREDAGAVTPKKRFLKDKPKQP